MAEIDDSLAAILAEAYKLVSDLHTNPETRGDFLKLFKKSRPKAFVPELDVAEPHVKRLDQIEKKLESALKGLKDKEDDKSLSSTFESLKKERGYTDESIGKIQRLMMSKTIPDPIVAADHFDRLNPPPKPVTPSSYAGSRFFTSEDQVSIKDWTKDPEGMSDKEIDKFLTEFGNAA